MKYDVRVIQKRNTDRKPTEKELAEQHELYLRHLGYSFYEKHTFVGTQGGSNVLGERDDCAPKSFGYDAE